MCVQAVCVQNEKSFRFPESIFNRLCLDCLPTSLHSTMSSSQVASLSLSCFPSFSGSTCGDAGMWDAQFLHTERCTHIGITTTSSQSENGV